LKGKSGRCGRYHLPPLNIGDLVWNIILDGLMKKLCCVDWGWHLSIEAGLYCLFTFENWFWTHRHWHD